MDSVYLNGKFMDGDAARISPRDRGFRLGDGVFETIPFFTKRPYQWSFHMERLAAGLATLQIHCEADWQVIAERLIADNALGDGFIRIAVSRGLGSRGYRPTNTKPTLFAEVMPRQPSPTSATVWLSEWRKPPPNMIPSHKLSHGINSTLALLEADQHDCEEALLLTPEGELCEAASGNLFWVKNDTLFTPALETGCLSGATRHAVIRLHEAPVQLVRAPLNALQDADAVFLTNCNWGILPVCALHPLGWQWQPVHEIMDALREALEKDRHSERAASAEESGSLVGSSSLARDDDD